MYIRNRGLQQSFMAVGMHVCARLPVNRTGRPSDSAVDRPVDRLQDPYSRVLPVDRDGRPTVQISVLKITYGRPPGRPEPTASCQVAFWSTGSCPDWYQRLYFESVLFFIGSNGYFVFPNG